MQDFVPFQFDNFTEGEKTPVLDLSLNKSKGDNSLLKDINAKLQILLEDRNAQNIKLIKMVLAEIAPALARNCSNEIINDFIAHRFPDLVKHKILDIYLPEDDVSSVKDNLEKLAVQNSYSGHIRLHRDSNLSYAECKIAWGNEEEVFSTEQILDKIREQLNGVLENE
ncbi:MAG: hypothetical protein IJZ59_07115 [Alphaproteobacteria bacterium]|nr:hypothetical protein [Alphaproteobacteria bacterium]